LPQLKRNAQNPQARRVLRPIIAASHAVSRATKTAKNSATQAASKATKSKKK